MADLTGREIGGCRLIRPIARGGMGEVYLGEQVRLGNRPVAVKVVRLDDGTLTPEMAAEVERRFVHEAALLGSFSHPNILPVHDAGVEDGLLYLVMDYVPDGSLAEAIRPGPARKLALPLDLALATDFVSQIASALQYTHDHGVVHRDVKPGNVLMRKTEDGRWTLLLADFGVARAAAEAGQRTPPTGTYLFMAPEQFEGTFAPASDQYALALVAYLLCAGHPPFEGDLAAVTRAQLHDPPPSLRAANPTIAPALEAVIQRGLAKSPGGRYPSVAAFAQSLRAATNAGDALVPGDDPEHRAPSRRRSRPPRWTPPTITPAPKGRSGLGRAWIAIVAAIVLLGGALGGAGLLRQHTEQAHVQATQTTQASAHAAATAAANATATATVAPAATATAAALIPTATATADIGTSVTSPPPAPGGVGPIVFADVAPTCHNGSALYPTWTVDNNTTATCPTTGGVELKATSTTTLGCIEQRAALPKDLYVSVLVTPLNGGAVIGFRQSALSSGGNTYSGIGYVYKVDRTQAAYGLFRVDSATDVNTLTSGSLGTTPGAEFAMETIAGGRVIDVYVNGQPIANATDGRYRSGWVSLCTDGDVVFQDVQVAGVTVPATR